MSLHSFSDLVLFLTQSSHHCLYFSSPSLRPFLGVLLQYPNRQPLNRPPPDPTHNRPQVTLHSPIIVIVVVGGGGDAHPRSLQHPRGTASATSQPARHAAPRAPQCRTAPHLPACVRYLLCDVSHPHPHHPSDQLRRRLGGRCPGADQIRSLAPSRCLPSRCLPVDDLRRTVRHGVVICL
ncbi:hypothetical protein BKA80DRAFT_113092 [Phyllosticta citrichinensis]